MNCNFCNKECTCHINPPCNFCTTHIECEICGQLVCESVSEEVTDMSDGSKLSLCPTCYDIDYDPPKRKRRINNE